ncbi:molybdopterin converting factor subunit 1 [Bacillus sp. FSL R5-0397]|uniref:molybdopterin converting factor subunit 1 n=1 Tax=Bacillus sp. FSL R5-0397 TaxID=2954558 RepID=UPI00315A9EA6
MISVLLFAGLAEKAGKQQIIIQKDQTTVDEIKIELQEVYGVDTAQNVMVAVNEIYTKGNAEVRSGDTVALIPPVSGG